ncbi:MAG: 4'-phosphopantetheinyl transferase superfamily protein [Planctomycetaceae bacterium]|jgi:phosphopantetheinyl transferase|nr:4'-phosphopantetheinyl transferase superfamily protein [Planctomycetaceae bacterium]MBT6154256.1 4'-phosphopantetheinyl transferase superfamily protein [Planctomycetaceae bacterium]MBT6485556.1 4'-phosphopantetheinyl transferase superfamily protein [Planctomycetaceae bacterium]MBT6494071.1 4'-phosphopantetheinyl transferase superfamily protein [Planctomycetaceae bacterium]
MPVPANGRIERFAQFDELRSACELCGSAWLSVAEKRELDLLRDGSRREAWLCGRWLSKHLIREACVLPATKLELIEILSRDAEGRGMRPAVTVSGEPISASLSISHSTHAVLVGVTTQPGISIGVDLTIPETVKPGFLRMWFTEAEQERLKSADSRLAMTYWAIKEAVYKACQNGESFAPRKIEVFDSVEGRFGCYYRGTDLRDVGDIQEREFDGHIAVVATMLEAVAVDRRQTNDLHRTEFCETC